MNWLSLILGGIALTVASLWVYFEILRPFRHLKRTLHDLTANNFRSIPLPQSSGIFKQCLNDIRKISELLQQFDRRIADEGFSLQAILAGMVEGVLIADRSQRIRLMNEALLTLFSLTESPVNRTVLETFRNHELQKTLETTLESGTPQKIDLTIETPTGQSGYQVRHFDVHVAGLNPKPHTSPTAALVVFHDVTKIRHIESTRREFLANVSHEFRTPLAIINGYIETLLDGATDDPGMTERSLKIMHKNGQRLSLLIEDLLTLSDLEYRAKLLEFRRENLKVILNRVIEAFESNIVARGAKIEINWQDGDAEADADGRRIEQVYSNLLDNALRYGEAGNLVIRISARREHDDLHISFSDNGPGIPFEDQAHIFERFYRVHKDRSRDAGGTGLGLSIVKNIVQAHGGVVSVESTPGGGATFHIRFPLSQGNPQLPARKK